MFLVIKTATDAHGRIAQTIQAVTTEEDLESHVLRVGLDKCEVYEATKLEFKVKWQHKNRRTDFDVSSD